MKTLTLRAAFLLVLTLFAWNSPGQGNPFAGLGKGPRFDGHMTKIFGANKEFASDIDVEAKPSDRLEPISMAGKLSFLNGRSRLEMDLTKIKGSLMDPGMVEQLKALGMAEMIIINQPENGSSFLVYPGLQSFARVNEDGTRSDPEKYTIESKEMAKETIAGQSCVKNQVTVTSPEGKKFESTVWTAPGMKNFPVRIQSNEGGTPFTITFKNVKLEKPAASLFEAPSTYAKYDDVPSLMRGALMKKFGEAAGAPAK